MGVDTKTKLAGRVAPILGLSGILSVLVAVGVLADGNESGAERALMGVFGVALLAAFAVMVPAMLRYFRG